MKHRTFFWFILPTFAAMVLFIALPIVSVLIQSLFVEHEQVLVVSESCGPFGCQKTTSIDAEATAALREAKPLGKFNGLGTYFDRSHLATAEVAETLLGTALHTRPGPDATGNGFRIGPPTHSSLKAIYRTLTDKL